MAIDCLYIFQHLFLVFIALPHSHHTLQTIKQITVVPFVIRDHKCHVRVYRIQGYVGERGQQPENIRIKYIVMEGSIADKGYTGICNRLPKFKFGHFVTT